MKHPSPRPWIAVLAVALWSLGCNTTAHIENSPLASYERGSGYGTGFAEIEDGDKVRVVLAFSGGGTRASALAYGVLKELRDTQVSVNGKPRRLLDQIALISSVSGGSFTSAYYGLHGDGIFDDFERRFLRRDFMSRLALSLLRPIELARIVFTPYTRSDMAIDLYDREIFDKATFADLAKIKGPTLNINATDIDVGTVFTFIQPNFDAICSDLSKVRVAQAVTASSAVPGAFAPLVLENNAGECNYPEPAWISDALAHPRADRRLYHDARSAATYLDSAKRPYVFLVDGGIADNIGARRIIGDVQHRGGVGALVEGTEVQIAEHIIYIVVNAQAGGKHSWDEKAAIPSLTSVLSSISSTGMYRYNFETIELLREDAAHWSEELRKHGTPVQSSVVEVAFDNLPDEKEREFFNDVETSFNLDDETVDRLIEVGGRLLRDDPDFKDFLKTLE